MRLRLTTDLVAGALLLGAAAVLVGTPNDGGACRNVAGAYALPPARVPSAEPPAPPAALAGARQAVSTASIDLASLADERAAAEAAQAAAEQARAAASEARSATWSTPLTYTSSSSEELDVDVAQSRVESAESWLQTVEDGAADTSLYGIWTEQDVAQAQDDLDTARAELASAEQALAAPQAEEAASAAAEVAAEDRAAELETAATAAETAASEAGRTLATAERDANARLSAAKSRVSSLEIQHEVAQAEWSHEQRLEQDEVVALNNVRASCRENGGWRAAVALVDVALLGALALRAVWPRTARLHRPRWLRR